MGVAGMGAEAGDTRNGTAWHALQVRRGCIPDARADTVQMTAGVAPPPPPAPPAPAPRWSPCTAPWTRRSAHSPSCTRAGRPRTPSAAPARVAKEEGMGGPGAGTQAERRPLCDPFHCNAPQTAACRLSCRQSCPSPPAPPPPPPCAAPPGVLARVPARATCSAHVKRGLHPHSGQTRTLRDLPRPLVSRLRFLPSWTDAFNVATTCAAHLLGQVDAVHRLVVLLGQRGVLGPQVAKLSLLGSRRLREPGAVEAAKGIQGSRA